MRPLVRVADLTENLNYYDILDVDRDASLQVIRLRYRRLMQHAGHHPDLGGDTAKAAMINKAYAVLSDAVQRSEYDAKLDILLRVAQGFEQSGDAPGTAAPPARFLDPAQKCVFCGTPHNRGAVREPDVSCDNCGSPLCRAENLRIEPSDKRAVARIDKRLTVTFFTDWRQPQGFTGHTEDISLHGLRLVTRRGVQTGQRIRLVSNIVEAVGSITHCVARRAGWKTEHVSGVSFVTLRFRRSAGGFLSQRV